jgi:RNA polymerase sigma-70 factor (ECF subfamily)
MFITDIWSDFFRFPAWMASLRRSSGGEGGGSGSGSGDGGDEDFEKIYKEHYEPVFRRFRRLGVPHEDAQDLTNETFLRVYRNIEEFRGESSVKTWIFSIAQRVWLNYVRWRHAEKREGEEVSLQDQEWRIESETLEKILEDEKKAKLYEALKSLPPRMRRCVLLRVHGNLMYREIAVLMKISIGTVKAQISQAQDRLAKELGQYFDTFDLPGDPDGE